MKAQYVRYYFLTGYPEASASMAGLELDTVINQMTEPMIIINRRDEIIFFNQIAQDWETVTAQPLVLGMPFLDIIKPEEQYLIRYILKQVRDSQLAQHTEMEIKDAQGRSFFFEIKFNPILTGKKDDDSPDICIISREITSQKTFEHRSLQLIRDFSALIEGANAVIFGVDSRGYITEWNKECVRITDFTKNDVYTRKAENLVHERQRTDFRNVLDTVLQGTAVPNFEMLLKTRDGASTVLLNASPRYNIAGAIIGALFVGQDISELSSYRKFLEKTVEDKTEELRRALDKEKEQVEEKKHFVSVASHEFRMPLSSIEASVKHISSNTSLRKRDESELDNIRKQVQRMKDLLNDILTLRKAEINPLKPQYENLDLVALLTRLSEEVRRTTEFSHHVRVTTSSASIVLDTDERLLRNIFINLLSNAIKYSPGQSAVFLDITEEANTVRVQVRDKGIGIEQGDREKIFQPFNRGSNASHIQGTGLGLSIVKKAVDALNGKLTIESKTGEGTAVTVEFPKHAGHKAAPVTSP